MIKFLLKYQIKINTINVHKNTALHITYLNKQNPIITKLLQFETSINSINHRDIINNHNLYNTFIYNSIINQIFPINILILFNDINNTHLFFPIYIYIKNNIQINQFNTKYLYINKYSF